MINLLSLRSKFLIGILIFFKTNPIEMYRNNNRKFVIVCLFPWKLPCAYIEKRYPSFVKKNLNRFITVCIEFEYNDENKKYRVKDAKKYHRVQKYSCRIR